MSSWPTQPEAEKARQTALAASIPALLVKMNSTQGVRYRVCLGRYESREAAEDDREELRLRGYADAWVLDLQEIPAADAKAVKQQTPLRTEPKPTLDESARRYARSEDDLAASAQLPAWLSRLREAIASGRPEAVRTFLHPAYGAYLLYKPGAYNVVQHLPTWAPAVEATPLRNATVRTQLLDDLAQYAAGIPKVGDLPVYDCSRDVWPEPGTYLGRLEGRDKKIRRMWVYMKREAVREQLTPAESTQAEAAEAATTHALILTNAKVVRSMLLARDANRWYLIGMDLLPPCD